MTDPGTAFIRVVEPAHELVAYLGEARLEEAAKALKEWVGKAIKGFRPNTWRGIRSDVRRYVAFCNAKGYVPLPASVEQLEAFIRDAVVRGRKRATIDRYLYSVSLLHDAAGLPNPTTDRFWRLTWRAIVLELADLDRNASDQVTGLGADAVAMILATLGDTPRDLRDAALLSLASDTMCRRSELAAVRVKHLRYKAATQSWTLRIPRGKTDTEGKGAFVHVSPETMERIQRWQATAGIKDGPLFVGIGGRPKASPPGTARRLPAVHAAPAPVATLSPPAPADPAPSEAALEPVADSSVAAVPATRESRHALGAQEIHRIFKRRALAAGVPDAARVGGHSTRIGTCQDLVAANFNLPAIMKDGRWKSERMPALYARELQTARGAVAQLRARQRRIDSAAGTLVDPADDGENHANGEEAIGVS